MIDLSAPATDVAPLLLGATIWHGPVAVRLTEVEAYMGLDDPASHAFRGPTPRARVMFGPPSHVYVYLSYGMHRCVNLVCSPDGVASAVLLRGGRVVAGEDDARLRRGGSPRTVSPADRETWARPWEQPSRSRGIRWNSSTPTPHRHPAGGSNPRTAPSNFVKAPGWGSAEMSTPPGGGGSPRTPLFLGLGSRNPACGIRRSGPVGHPEPTLLGHDDKKSRPTGGLITGVMEPFVSREFSTHGTNVSQGHRPHQGHEARQPRSQTPRSPPRARKRPGPAPTAGPGRLRITGGPAKLSPTPSKSGSTQ